MQGDGEVQFFDRNPVIRYVNDEYWAADFASC